MTRCIILGLLVCIGCAHQYKETYRYRFTCPDGKVLYLRVSLAELQNQNALYERVIKECKNERNQSVDGDEK